MLWRNLSPVDGCDCCNRKLLNLTPVVYGCAVMPKPSRRKRLPGDGPTRLSSWPRIAIRDRIIHPGDAEVVLHVLTTYTQPPLLTGKLTLKLPASLRGSKRGRNTKKSQPGSH